LKVMEGIPYREGVLVCTASTVELRLISIRKKEQKR
jgi:hypothetical protein